jgi:hypothetical protein
MEQLTSEHPSRIAVRLLSSRTSRSPAETQVAIAATSECSTQTLAHRGESADWRVFRGSTVFHSQLRKAGQWRRCVHLGRPGRRRRRRERRRSRQSCRKELYRSPGCENDQLCKEKVRNIADNLTTMGVVVSRIASIGMTV